MLGGVDSRVVTESANSAVSCPSLVHTWSWVTMLNSSRVLPAPVAPKNGRTVSGASPGRCSSGWPQYGQKAAIRDEPNSSRVFIRVPHWQRRRMMPNRPGRTSR